MSERSVVLIISRDSRRRSILESALRDQGVTLMQGAGQHAIALCRATGVRPDLVISDCPLRWAGSPLLILEDGITAESLVARVGKLLHATGRRREPGTGCPASL